MASNIIYMPNTQSLNGSENLTHTNSKCPKLNLPSLPNPVHQSSLCPSRVTPSTLVSFPSQKPRCHCWALHLLDVQSPTSVENNTHKSVESVLSSAFLTAVTLVQVLISYLYHCSSYLNGILTSSFVPLQSKSGSTWLLLFPSKTISVLPVA